MTANYDANAAPYSCVRTSAMRYRNAWHNSRAFSRLTQVAIASKQPQSQYYGDT